MTPFSLIQRPTLTRTSSPPRSAFSNEPTLRLTVATGAALLMAAVCAGCVVAGGDGGGEVSYGYGVNFYEPFDNNGEWGPGYLVGPPRGGEAWRHDSPGAHRYHDAEPNHAMPSIPHGPSGGHDQHR